MEQGGVGGEVGPEGPGEEAGRSMERGRELPVGEGSLQWVAVSGHLRSFCVMSVFRRLQHGGLQTCCVRLLKMLKAF